MAILGCGRAIVPVMLLVRILKMPDAKMRFLHGPQSAVIAENIKGNL
jgi:hypothetical protein